MNVHIDVEHAGTHTINHIANFHNTINIPAENHVNNNADPEAAEAEPPLRLDAFPRGRCFLIAALSCVVVTILAILLASILPWFEITGGVAKYYAQDQFLWLFLLPPLSAVPLMFSSLALMGRICWLHCWTVTVISIDVPSAVIFVSFGASLVYSGIGAVLWSVGAFLVIFAHFMSIIGGLLFMKLAQIIEMGPPEEEEGPSKGPLTVAIGAEDLSASQEERICVLEKTPSKYYSISAPGSSTS